MTAKIKRFQGVAQWNVAPHRLRDEYGISHARARVWPVWKFRPDGNVGGPPIHG